MRHALIAILAGVVVACARPSSTPTTTAVASPTAAAPSHADSIAAERTRFAQEVLAMIKGRENVPAESVFTNLKVLGGFPAVNLVRAMDQGWSKALGVSCTHCHVPGDWSND